MAGGGVEWSMQWITLSVYRVSIMVRIDLEAGY